MGLHGQRRTKKKPGVKQQTASRMKVSARCRASIPAQCSKPRTGNCRAVFRGFREAGSERSARHAWSAGLTGPAAVSYTRRTTMYILFLLVHVVVCIFLIIVVLLQSGKAADLAGAFGGMGSQTAFGPRGSATLLSKATTISAVLFMVTSLSLSILATRNAGLGTTVLEDQQQQQQKKGPVQSIPVQIPGQQQGQPAGPPMRIPLPPPGTPPPPGAPGAPAPAQSAPVQSAPAQPAPVKK